jgi:outer membrane receptor protein involved in Fe transport
VLILIPTAALRRSRAAGKAAPSVHSGAPARGLLLCWTDFGHPGFDGSYSQNPQSRTGTGSGLADVELGLAQTVVTSTVGLSNLRANNDYWYFQDDWKVSPLLTLNFGLRYELYWPLYEAQNGLSHFVVDPTNPNFGHMIFAGLNGQSRSMMKVDPHNFAPRFGFAYRIPHSGDMVIRGGYGMFYGNPDEQTGVGQMMTNNPPFVGQELIHIGTAARTPHRPDIVCQYPQRPVARRLSGSSSTV